MMQRMRAAVSFMEGSAATAAATAVAAAVAWPAQQAITTGTTAVVQVQAAVWVQPTPPQAAMHGSTQAAEVVVAAALAALQQQRMQQQLRRLLVRQQLQQQRRLSGTRNPHQRRGSTGITRQLTARPAATAAPQAQPAASTCVCDVVYMVAV